jgi:hypothetical protein
MIRKYLWMLMLPVCLFFACNKEMSQEGDPTTPTLPVIKSPVSDKQVSSSLQGIILDENNKPLPGAQVKYGNATVTTDATGSFLFNKVNATEVAAVLNVQKNGYFNGVRTFRIAEAVKLQYVQIQLLPKKVAGTFQAANGGTITATNAQFTFAAQQVLGADNKPYSGKVSLLYAPINPERADFADIMPGDLRGINSSNTIVGLQSFGMMALELQSETGEKLHLDTTKSVSFKMTIPASLQSSAPSTIPLWYFEEASGLWREEGRATKTGDSYTGTVKHFSFWNCDAQFPIVNFRVTLQDAAGTPLANAQISIKRSNGSSAFGYTNEDGVVSGDIPKGEILSVQLLTQCNSAINVRDIGPFSDSTNLGIIKVAIPPINYIHFSGAVSTCDSKPVKNGEVIISVDHVAYRTRVNDGKYAIAMLRCQTDQVFATINATDEDANKMSTVNIPVTVNSYVKDLVACDVIQPDFINMLLNGQPLNITATDTIGLYNSGQSYSLRGRTNSGTSLSIDMPNIKVGSYSDANFYFSAANQWYSPTKATYTITQTGSIGDYLIGSFDAKVSKDSASTNPTALTGTFRVRIKQ